METMTAERTGVIYMLSRPDLGKCYVGQTLNFNDRMSRHRNDRHKYIYAELFADGISPEITVLHPDVLPENMDAVEADEMRAQATAGQIVINALGPDDKWPHVPVEVAAQGHKVRKTHGFTVMHARRKEDPEAEAKFQATISQNMKTLHARRAADPEFDKTCREAEARGRLKGAEVRRIKRVTDPDWAARERESARKGGLAGGHKGGLARINGLLAMRRKCLECDLPATNPGALGQHQRWSGHTQWSEIVAKPLTGE